MIPLIKIKETNLNVKSNPEIKKKYSEFVDSNHSFIAVLQNQILWQVTGEYARHLKDNFEKLVVVGIGGSHLGAESFIKALTFPRKVIFLENPDPVGLARRWESIENLDKTHFLFVSKSGETFETLAIANWVIDQLNSRKIDIPKHCSVLTANNEGSLKKWSDKEGAWCLMFPEELSGRYSALSPVGMLPLMFGLGKTLEQFFTEFFLGVDSVLKSDDRGIELLGIYKDVVEKKFKILNFWVYSDQMLGFGKWLRQLWSESLGQLSVAQDRLPVFVLSKGASDQHSYLQQVIAQRGEQVNFVLTLKGVSADFTNQGLTKDHFSSKWGFGEQTFLDIFNEESEGLVKTFKELEIPFVHLELDEINLGTLVDFVFIHQLVVATLGKDMEINAFEQPQVEEMKKRISELRKGKLN